MTTAAVRQDITRAALHRRGIDGPGDFGFVTEEALGATRPRGQGAAPKGLMSSLTGSPDTIAAHLDAFSDGRILGWAQSPERPNDPVVLQLHIGSRHVLSCRADLYRPDLAAAGLGSGRHGFAIDVAPALLERARRSGEALVVRWANEPEKLLFAIDLDEKLSVPGELTGWLVARLDRKRRDIPARPAPRLPPLGAGQAASPYLRLFEAATSSATASAGRPVLFPYAEHVRRLRQLESDFDPDRIDADFDHFIRWYLDNYAAARVPRRAPLSRGTIQWLNEPVVVGGSSFELTRVVLWYLADHEAPHGLNSICDLDRYRTLLCWWATERAPALGVEDCLVTRGQVETLRDVPHQWAGQDFPLSAFMERALASRPSLASFEAMQSVSARMTAYFVLLVEAVDEPGLLRFLPSPVLQRFFAGDDPLFDELARTALRDEAEPEPLTAAFYRELLARNGFDLETLRFTTIDRRGHRSEVARARSSIDDEQFDVRLVGPVGKVSGVAHASRLSWAILQETPYTTVLTDFALDNPQPEQEAFAKRPAVSVKAHVNLIHINADMLPAAYAYLPDIQGHAYTIGFFFWELDTPAASHRLALDLVDEIWVASDYNRRCFSSATTKPVLNVGMALEPRPIPPREEARAAIQRFCGAEPDEFVFFATYDALSYVSRKNPLGLLRAFQHAFPGDERVRLVIKTHNAAAISAGTGRRVWQALLRASAKDPRLTIVNETLPYDSLMALKAGSDCYVSLHRSEGFGFGMLEAMRLRISVVCTGYSGNADFCDDATAWLVDGDEVNVRADEYIYAMPGHRWAEPSHEHAVATLRAVRDDPHRRAERIAAAAARVDSVYSIEAAAKRYAERLAVILAGRPAPALRPEASRPAVIDQTSDPTDPPAPGATENVSDVQPASEQRRGLLDRIRGI